MFYYPSALVGKSSLCAILWITVATRYHWDKKQSITEASKKTVTWAENEIITAKQQVILFIGSYESSYTRLTRETLINIATPLGLQSPAQTALPSLWMGLDSDLAGYRINWLGNWPVVALRVFGLFISGSVVSLPPKKISAISWLSQIWSRDSRYLRNYRLKNGQLLSQRYSQRFNPSGMYCNTGIQMIKEFTQTSTSYSIQPVLRFENLATSFTLNNLAAKSKWSLPCLKFQSTVLLFCLMPTVGRCLGSGREVHCIMISSRNGTALKRAEIHGGWVYPQTIRSLWLKFCLDKTTDKAYQMTALIHGQIHSRVEFRDGGEELHV